MNLSEQEKELINLIRLYHRAFPNMEEQFERMIYQALDDLLDRS